jgi:hypothetical protein
VRSMTAKRSRKRVASVDRRNGEVYRFRNAEPAGVARGQDGAMLGKFDAVEKLNDCGRAEHDGDGLWLLRFGDHRVDRPRPRKRDGVEKPQRRDRDD